MSTIVKAYELRQFSRESFSATRNDWEKQLKKLSGELLASEYERILCWAGDHIDYDGHGTETFAYGIFAANTTVADAIVELVYPKSGRKWLKLLNLHLCPAIDLSFNGKNLDIHKLGSLFCEAVEGTVNLTSTAHPAKVTKLYGRSGTLLAFLKGIGTYIERNGSIKGVRVSLEGRWLVFKTDEEN